MEEHPASISEGFYIQVLTLAVKITFNPTRTNLNESMFLKLER